MTTPSQRVTSLPVEASFRDGLIEEFSGGYINVSIPNLDYTNDYPHIPPDQGNVITGSLEDWRRTRPGQSS